MKLRTVVVACVFSTSLAGCSGPRAPLNPPQLVTDSDSDMAVQLFMQATLAMAKYHGYTTLSYGEISRRAEANGLSTLPFMPPEMIRATPSLRGADAKRALDVVARAEATKGNNQTNPTKEKDINPDEAANYLEYREKVDSWKYGYEGLVRYYVTTGWKASQIICRNYMLRLDERNQYLEFLRKEFGVAYSLASGVLTAVHANGALTTAFLLANTGTNSAIEEYQNYRYLQIADREAARVLVSAAQDRYAEYFLRQISERKGALKAGEPQTTLDLFTFSEALNAVSTIEYQCTREGIHNLATKTLNNSPTNLLIDPTTGAVVFKSSKESVEKALVADRAKTVEMLAAALASKKKAADALVAKKKNAPQKKADSKDSVVPKVPEPSKADAAAKKKADEEAQKIEAEKKKKEDELKNNPGGAAPAPSSAPVEPPKN